MTTIALKRSALPIVQPYTDVATSKKRLNPRKNAPSTALTGLMKSQPSARPASRPGVK